jgi:hypothetical protein
VTRSVVRGRVGTVRIASNFLFGGFSWDMECKYELEFWLLEQVLALAQQEMIAVYRRRKAWGFWGVSVNHHGRSGTMLRLAKSGH